jgi:hypothetical protein
MWSMAEPATIALTGRSGQRRDSGVDHGAAGGAGGGRGGAGGEFGRAKELAGDRDAELSIVDKRGQISWRVEGKRHVRGAGADEVGAHHGSLAEAEPGHEVVGQVVGVGETGCGGVEADDRHQGRTHIGLV